jgi:uncharacterized protein
MLRCLTPHLRVESVLDLTVQRLRDLGLEALLLDADCTLKRYGTASCAPDVEGWIQGLQEAGLRLCLVSNGHGRRIGQFAESLGLPFVAHACKPLPLGVTAAMHKLGTARPHTAMVGDQVFADVMAGRLAGVYTILVRPLGPEEEPWFTRLKRRPEALVLRRMDAAAGNRATSPQN